MTARGSAPGPRFLFLERKRNPKELCAKLRFATTKNKRTHAERRRPKVSPAFSKAAGSRGRAPGRALRRGISPAVPARSAERAAPRPAPRQKAGSTPPISATEPNRRLRRQPHRPPRRADQGLRPWTPVPFFEKKGTEKALAQNCVLLEFEKKVPGRL